ncbi:MAG: response regulator transcription factor [Bacteroidota bacterium]
MKKIKCLIVDDEPLAAGLIKKHLEQFSQFELVASCWNAMEAFEILKKDAIDLLFLDIQMPVLNGIDFVKSLKHPPKVIFVTAYRDYAVESYELDVVDYIVKPITFDRFFKAVNKFLNQFEGPVTLSLKVSEAAESEQNDFIYVNSNRKFIKVKFDEVLYIESLKDYIRIHLSDQKIMTKEKISDFIEKLPNHFIRIHRSFIINAQQVTAFTNHDVEINGQEIPIGISYKKMVFDFLKNR